MYEHIMLYHTYKAIYVFTVTVARNAKKHILRMYRNSLSLYGRYLPTYITVLVLSKLKKNATPPQPQRTVLKCFAIFKNVAHSLEPGETPSYSASHQAPNYVQRS